MSQVSYGTITITDTNDIERIYVVFAKSNNPDTAPSMSASTWTEDITQAPGTGDYIWQRTAVKKSGPTSSTNPSYSDPVRLTGEEGNPAKEIIAVETQYGTSANWNTQPANWTADVPTYDENNPKYWIRTRLKYEDNTYSDWVSSKDNGLTDAMAIANEALAQSEEALQTAIQVDTLLGGHFIYGDTLPQTTPAGARVVEQIKEGTTDVSGNPGKWHHNVTIGSNGIQLRYNEAVMAQLAANQSGNDTALKFYQPPTVNGNTTTQGALTMELSGNALKFYKPGTVNKGMELTNTALKFYDATGTAVQAEFGGTQATISGTINVYDGKIGNNTDSYWYIGNYLDYRQNNSAAIKSHGTAFIQLGNSLTWRIATNRIHTAWNDDSSTGEAFRLHFPVYDNKYWDSGLHLPLSTTDKFLYMRNAPNTQTLENLNDDLEDNGYNYWTYKFYVDGNGAAYAQNFYKWTNGSWAPIDSGTVSAAGRLTTGAGSLTQPVFFPSTGDNAGQPVATTYQLNAAGAKGVDTSMPDTATNNNVPTTLLMKTFVEGKGYLTSETDPTVPAWAKASSKPSYALSELTNAQDIQAIEILSGNSGLLRKTAANTWILDTNTYLTSYTETDPTVPSWAKTPSKPSYALSELTNAQDVQAIELLSGTSGLLKKTAANTWTLDTNTYLTSYTETDPIFVASAAHGITSSDITNWNNKTSNVGTVTTVSTGAGLVGGDITSTGTIKVNLTSETKLTNAALSVTEDANRIYPIRIDKNNKMVVVVPWTNVNSNYLTGITFNDVTTALNYTPYNSTNPNGYTTNTGTVTSVRVQASSPLQSSTSTAQSTSLNTTISFINQDANKILAGPSSGNAAAPSFRSLVAADIPNLSWTKITSNKPTTLNGYGITDAADLTAITGVEISDAQLTITRANGTSTSTSVTITASQATGATKLIKIVNNTPQDAAAGSETLPVYFTGGYPQAVTSIAKLNGTATTYPEFYAPVSAGTSGYVLKSNGSGAPTWIPQSDISSGNTYTTTIAADNGTNQLTLAHGTKYKLTAGGTSFIFTMPTDTDEKLKVAAVTSETTYYPIVGTGANAATRQYDTTGFVYVGTNGTANGTNGNALLTLGNSTASTTANWKKGTIRLYGTTSYYTDIVSGAPSANRTITLPNATGTIALTSQIPTVPTTTGSSTTGISIAAHSTTSVGSASNWNAGTASTWAFEDKTVATAASTVTEIPNVTNAGATPTLGTAIKVQSKASGGNGTAPTLGTAIKVQSKASGGNGTAPTLNFTIDGTDTMQLNISWSAGSASNWSFEEKTVPNVTNVGSASTWTFEEKTIPNVTNVGATPEFGTPISITGVGGTTTVSSKKSGSNSTVPSLTITSTTVTSGTTHSITDTGHTHTI